MNKRFRMISLLAEAVGLELEEARDLDKKYEREFVKDFGEAMSYLVGKSLEKQSNLKNRKNTKEIQSASKNHELEVVKEIYRKLARKTHPDVASEETADEFKEIQRAYSDNDLSSLLAAANRHNVTTELTSEDAHTLRTQIQEQKKEIKTLKETVRWAWAHSDKSNQVRENILISMGVDLESFAKWRKENF